MYKFYCYIILFALLLLSCSSEKQPGPQTRTPATPEDKTISESAKPSSLAHPDTYSLKISPQTASRDTTFYAVPKNFSPRETRIQWLINGEPAPDAGGRRFKPQNARKGDLVQATAKINNTEILSNTVMIKNSPPEMSRVRIITEGLKPGNILRVEAEATDSDEDAVTIFYEWTVNEEPAGKGETIDVPLKRDDKISVKTTPFDGENYGEPVVLNREILNAPPEIIEDKNFTFDGKIYTCQVKAEDPDYDPLTYSLKSAPEDITIDPKTGVITWVVPPDFKGKVPVTVSVTDGNGGETTRRLTLIIDLLP